MPHTEPTHASTEIINPVSAAFIHYIQELQEQYPGIFTRIGTNTRDPYLITGRLFFDQFEVNSESFNFTHDPLTPREIENILRPINHAFINLGLSPFSDPKKALRKPAQCYLQETIQKTFLPPHEHLSQALTEHKEILQELMGFIDVLTPQYTKEHIELLLDYRNKANQTILTSDGIHLLNGFFAYDSNNLKTPEHIQAQARARVAGAVLFKVITVAEKTLEKPLSIPLKKFITKVTNTASDNADIILEELQTNYKDTLKNQLSLNLLRDYLKNPEENKERIETSVEHLALTLDTLIKDDTFIAFHEHSFIVFFETLLDECKTLSDYQETQRQCYTKILGFMINQFDRFKDHATAIPLAIDLLKAMHFREKKHLRTNPDYKRHQDCLARCEAQLSKEDFKKMLTKADPLDKFEQLLRKASLEIEPEVIITRRNHAFDKNKTRSKSAFFNDNTPTQSPPRQRHHFQIKKMSLTRPSSHDDHSMQNTAAETKSSTSPRPSPKHSRKKEGSPEQPRKLQNITVVGKQPKHERPSSSNTSPTTPRPTEKKQRKHSNPPPHETSHYAGTLFTQPAAPEKPDNAPTQEPGMRTLKANRRSVRE